MPTRSCTACGADNPADALFCGHCGASLGRECPSCHAVVAREAAFCTTCGTALEPSPAAPTAEERKVVSVLFADLVGFTGRAERLDPEDVRALLAPYHARVRAELERFSGTVEKFIGDAIVALFGAPVAHEDDPERAVRAALAVREAIAEMNAADPSLDLQVRVGVTTGEALVARDARPSEGEGMATGDVVNTAARLQTAAPVDGVLVDETTHRHTQDAIEYREHEPVAAKGKSEAVAVWEAVAPRARLGVDIAFRGGAELIGRDAELAALRDAVGRAARGGTAQLVTLIGEPGIGKSRLIYELWAELDADPDLYVFWRQGRSLPYGDGVSFWALGEMTKAHAGILESDDAQAAEDKLHEAVVQAVADQAEAGWVETHLRPLVGLGTGQGSDDRRTESFAAWRRFFESLADQRPVVLVFEDLHWADEGLLDFIDHLVDWTGDSPLLVVCTTRPELLERRPDWGGGKRNAATISLAPLGVDDTARLLEALAGGADREIVARSGGNPLYAEEYARMLSQRGGGADIVLPDSVHGIIAARLDTLPPDEKALVQDAAVLGKVFWTGELAYVARLETSALAAGLHALERKEFIRRERRSSLADDTAYVFRHVLVRDVAYGQIPRGRRAEKHRLAADWIDSLAGDRREDLADVVAHHYVSALELEQATGRPSEPLAERARLALRDAGDRARALNSFGPAARFYRHALDLWPDDAERPQLLLQLGRSLYNSGEDGEGTLEQAAEELLDAGDRAGAAEAEIMLAELAWLRGRRDLVAQHRESAVALVAEEPPSPAKAYVLANLPRLLSNIDEHEAAVRAGLEAHELAERLGLDDLRAHTLITMGTSRALSGDLEGVADLERAIALAREANSPQASRGLNNLATVYVHLGQLARAFEHYEEARREAERFGHGVALRWLAGERVVENYWRGLWDEALASSAALLDESGVGGLLQQIDALLVRAKIQLARADAPSAEAIAGRAVVAARAADDVQNLFPALAVGAHIAIGSGNDKQGAELVDELLTHWGDAGRVLPSWWFVDLVVAFESLGRRREFDLIRSRVAVATLWFDAAASAADGAWLRAAGLFAEIGSAPDEAFARLRAAEELVAAGRSTEAEPELAAALAFYRSVRATAHIERAEAALAAVPGA
jgi:class 3 adenylate cyclase/tetratricopeptide (TPR) repeat protein